MFGEKILVVDDSESVRETFISAFEEYTIITAGNAQEALNVMKNSDDIRLIVLDVMMPDKCGLDLLKDIKEINEYCKVVVMTGYSTKDVAIEALRLDADEYIEKPFDIAKVKVILEKLLNGSGDLGKQRSGKTDEKIKFAELFIKKHYNKHFSLEEIAGKACLNYKYFSRIFKEKTGKSFIEYKLGLRMSSAKRFLDGCGWTVSQIAYKIGYQNPDSFMKMFKKFTGFTPSGYRNQNKRKKTGR